MKSRAFWCIFIVGAVLLVANRWDALYAGSVDMGLHYALTNALYTHLGTTGITREHLDVMYDYPAGSHWIAAIVSLVTGYPLASINGIAILCIYVTYVCIALVLVDRSPSLTATRMCAMLVAIGYLASQSAAFGFQVIGNYFYPQLIGETLVFVALLYLTLPQFWALPRMDQTVLLAACAWLLGYIQPLAAIQFGGSVILLLALRTILPELRTGWKWRSLVRLTLVTLVVIGAVLFNPSFRKMTAVALNNGALSFGSSLAVWHYSGLLLCGVAAGVLAIAAALRGIMSRAHALPLAAGCFCAVALFVGQALFYVYGAVGSAYAVKKHVFFLANVTAVTFAYALPTMLPSFGRKLRRWTTSTAMAVAPLFALFAVGLVFMNAGTPKVDVREVLDYQSFVKHYEKYALPIDGAGNTVSLNYTLSPYVNHMVSLGDLGLPHRIAAIAFTSTETPPVRYAIIASRLADAETLQRCSILNGLGSTYAVVDRQCYVESMTTISVNAPVATVAGTQHHYLREGWSPAEGWGTWSVSDRAQIEFSIRGGRPGNRYVLVLKYVPFTAGVRTTQIFTVIADGVRGQPEVATGSDPREYVVQLGDGRLHTVDIEIENPVSPSELGVSASDTRRLGIGLLGLRVVPYDVLSRP